MRVSAHYWWTLAAVNCTVGMGAVGLLYLNEKDAPARPPIVTTPTTETPRGSTTTVPYNTTGVGTSVPPPTLTPTSSILFGSTTTTLFGSPFTTGPLPTVIVPPSAASTTSALSTTPPTVAPCPPCPTFGFDVLAATTVTNTGPTTVGRVGLWPGTAVTGFPPGAAIDAASPTSAAAQGALTVAYLEAFARTPTVIAAELGGRTLGPGTYTALTPFEVTGTLTLDGLGPYTFQTDSTLVTASASRVRPTNGARPCDVTWVVGSSATLGTHSTFTGTILALTSITVTTGVTVDGRVLARNGAVTLDSDTFSAIACP